MATSVSHFLKDVFLQGAWRGLRLGLTTYLTTLLQTTSFESMLDQMSEMDVAIHFGSSKLIAFATLIKDVEDQEVFPTLLNSDVETGYEEGGRAVGVTPEKRV